MTEGKNGRDLIIVGIGASAGGLEALEQFFGAVPAESGMAFVVIQHLSPDFKSLMNELLARHTGMPVRRVEDGLVIEPNHVYLNPPRKNVLLSGRALKVIDQDDSGGLNMPIDFFFRSLARDVGDRAVGVVLSGTGSDGSRGVIDLHRAGGCVVAQDADSAGFDGMPRSTIATGVVDLIATPAEIARVLGDVGGQPNRLRERLAESLSSDTQPETAAVLHLFRLRYGIDFALYKPATFHRRLERRMRLAGYQDMSKYVEELRKNARALDVLYHDMLVEVTEFFRDTEPFDLMRRQIVPKLVAAADPKTPLRVWVAGCATGEEAYSLAMLLDDACEQDGRGVEYKVFATDVHQRSLETASTGVYSREAVEHVPLALRERYLESRQNLFHINSRIRRRVLFAPHDITKDPPFTKCDLITCRNVLIYLRATVQQRVIAQFHFGLKVDGVLFLGSSESTGALEKEFDVLDSRWRIYRKLRDTRLADVPNTLLSGTLRSVVQSQPAFVASPVLRRGDEKAVAGVIHNILEERLPPALLIDEHYELVHSFGDARRLLVQPIGPPTLDVLRMVEGDLRMALSAALHRASRRRKRTAYRRVDIPSADGTRTVDVIVTPYECGGMRMYLAAFENSPIRAIIEAQVETHEISDSTKERDSRIAELEDELRSTKETLRSTVEDLEASNEELQATNEELVASNEELQSTNEELHSVNEELYTVNAEHQRKIEELTELTADMDNLLKSTEIGTIFLDSNLCIRSFTPAIASVFHVLERDVGRPIEHIAYKLENPNVLDEVREVMERRESMEREVRSPDGHVFLQRITPYRTGRGDIDGVVLTFIAVPQLEASEARFDSIVDALRDVIWVTDAPDGGRVLFVNRMFEQIWGVGSQELYASGKLWHEWAIEEDRERVVAAYSRYLIDEKYDAVYRIRRPNGEIRWIHDRGMPVYDASGEIVQFAGVARDVTADQLSASGVSSLLSTSAEAVLVVALDGGRVIAANDGASRLYGRGVDELSEMTLRDLLPEGRWPEGDRVLRTLAEGRAILGLRTAHRRKSGEEFEVDMNAWSTRLNDESAAMFLCCPIADDQLNRIRDDLESLLEGAESLDD